MRVQARERRKAKRVTVRVLGRKDDRGNVRLDDFISKLDALRDALRETDRLAGHVGKQRSYWRIVDLSHKSPATVVLEEVQGQDVRTGRGRDASTLLISNLKRIQKSAVIPENQRDIAAIESYQTLANAAVRDADEFQISVGRQKIQINESVRASLEQAIGPDEFTFGSVSGWLYAINLHNAFRFQIYPVVGPRRVTCTFPSNLKDQSVSALERYVVVHGRLRYKSWSPHPHAIDVDSIEVMPHATDLPKLADLRGLAPEATGTQSAEDFVRGQRDGNW